MKIRTKAEFQSEMDNESAWRTQELAHIRKLAHSARDSSPNSRVILRASHALLYAHWEGWIKKISKYYLDYVKSTRVPIKDLNYGLAGSALRAEMQRLQDSSMHTITSEVARFILEHGLTGRPKFKDDTIDTGSNLSSRLFEDIVLKLGLEPRKYNMKTHMIDAQLLKTRNEIAHGEHTRLKGDDMNESRILSPEVYLELHDKIVSTLRQFHNDVIEAITHDTFIRANNQTA